MDRQFLQERITRTRARIIALEDALAAVRGGAKSYSTDTGQTRIQVTKHSISELLDAISKEVNQLATLEARANRTGRLRIIPRF